jgi:hypothetical protein
LKKGDRGGFSSEFSNPPAPPFAKGGYVVSHVEQQTVLAETENLFGEVERWRRRRKR